MGGLSKFEECPVCGEELSWEDRREFSFEPRRYRSLTTAEARGVGVVRFWDDGRKYSFEPRRYRGHAADVWKNMNPEAKEKLSSGLATSFQDWLSLTPIDQALAPYGLISYDVGADGDCQFRALAFHLLGDANRHAEVRASVVDEMRNHPDRYRDFAEE